MDKEGNTPEFDEDKLAEITEAVAKDAGADIKQAVVTFSENVFKHGMSPKQAIGLSDDKIEGLYGQAYRMYNNGKYDDAIDVFRLLAILDPADPKYLMGIAASLHQQKKYIEAIKMYVATTLIDPSNPIPYYHCSDCYLKRNLPTAAVEVLVHVVKLSGDKSQYAVIKARAQAMISTLKATAQTTKGKKTTTKKGKAKKKKA